MVVQIMQMIMRKRPDKQSKQTILMSTKRYRINGRLLGEWIFGGYDGAILPL